MCKNNILKSLRASQDITQKRMAEVLEISVPTYNRKELGIRAFTLEESMKISNLFDKTVEEIFFKPKVNTNETEAI